MDKSNTQEIIQIEPFLEDFTFSYYKSAVVRRFLLLNHTPYTLNVTFEIRPNLNEFMNYRIPSSPIWISIKPKSNAQIFALSKIFPNVEWGDYETFFNIQKHVQGVNNNIGSGSPSKDSDYNKKESSFHRSYDTSIKEI